ncbi:MAG: DUF1223 domain-containing protein [Alphaproteobacteria bacterium]
MSRALVAVALLWAASGPSSLPAIAQVAGAAGSGLTVQTSVVVVELYTSQGCSSCPPADAYLGDLAKRDDLIALALHVDYWNYIGWTDPFSIENAGRRQYAYQQSLGTRFVYTPQMVIDGRFAATGLDRREVETLIARARQRNKLLVSVVPEGVGSLRIGLPDTPFGEQVEDMATVWLFVYDDEHATAVDAGENAGRHLVNARVVRWAGRIGDWRGEARDLIAGVPVPGDGVVVLVQSRAMGQIMGVGAMRLR